MSSINKSKAKQINDIVSVVKLSALLFLGLIIFIEDLDDKKIININLKHQYNIETVFFAVAALLLIYFLWAFFTRKKLNTKYRSSIEIFENMVFLVLFFIIIVITGCGESQYKFLFLFIIVTTTIQCGMRQGMALAIISSVIILSIDLISAPDSVINKQFEMDLIIAGVFILTAWPLGYYVKIESEHIEKLENLVNKDGLTETYNHRYFHEALSQQIKVHEKAKKTLCLMFLDIDYFKHYNDLYGHQSGDVVLKELGSLFKECVRERDSVCRYGGEEFAIILPDTSEKEATILAEKVRNSVENKYFHGQENQPNETITVSIGISIFPDKADSDTALIKSADDALYRAKFFNKNRVETYTSILEEIKKDIDDKDIELVTSIKTLISVINAKDRYTYAHSERLVFYSKLFASYIGLNKQDEKILIYGAYMHDIGKINIAKEILVKKMPLTAEEWNILKEHPENGVEIIKSVKSLEAIVPLIRHHHEKYDGTGYPMGLKGKQIPYLVRVLTVIDSFDAMTSNRPYNKRKTYAEGIQELKKFSGIQFDPEIAEAFIETIKVNKDKLD